MTLVWIFNDIRRCRSKFAKTRSAWHSQHYEELVQHKFTASHGLDNEDFFFINLFSTTACKFVMVRHCHDFRDNQWATIGASKD